MSLSHLEQYKSYMAHSSLFQHCWLSGCRVTGILNEALKELPSFVWLCWFECRKTEKLFESTVCELSMGPSSQLFFSRSISSVDSQVPPWKCPVFFTRELSLKGRQLILCGFTRTVEAFTVLNHRTTAKSELLGFKERSLPLAAAPQPGTSGCQPKLKAAFQQP